MNKKTQYELFKLTEALLEERISQADLAQLEQLVLTDQDGMDCYLDLMELHGNLAWDAAGKGAHIDFIDGAELLTVQKHSLSESAGLQKSKSRKMLVSVLALSLLAVVSIGWWVQLKFGPDAGNETVAENEQNSPDSEKPDRSEDSIVQVHLPDRGVVDQDLETTTPIVAESAPARDIPEIDISDDRNVVAFINQQLAEGWQDNEVVPSAQAADSEWVRRVYLDLAGRIPTSAEVESFFADNRTNRKDLLIDSLLASRDYAGNFATLWTNLLVGRLQGEKFDRPELYAYLENQFGENRPWSETAADLISATGRADESGPANFLLAHLNNQAVPATAITTRIFLCEQMQCSQCHVHPTVAEWGQNRFWEFNAFFQQTKIRDQLVTDQKSGKKQRVRKLVDVEAPPSDPNQKSKPSPAFYETLRGVMQVAYPRFAGVDVTPQSDLSLRQQLAQLLASPENPQFSAAYVNRSWQHFFGFAFTVNVDDMGPHSRVSHPILLAGLGRAFEESGYDVHRLLKWICLSDAYQLSSTPQAGNQLDDPESGDVPYFSRMYLKPMSPEQLYNSLLIAAGASSEQLLGKEQFLQDREQWLRQFYTAAENEENGEFTSFDGSLPQALLMMNGNLIQRAIDTEQSSLLRDVVKNPKQSEVERINSLCLAALSRYPTDQELSSIRKMLRTHVRQRTSQEIPAKTALQEGLRDLYWAYLNSSEFSINH